MIKFILDKVFKNETVVADLADIQKHAKIIDYKLEQLINGETDGVSRDELTLVMQEVPLEVYYSQDILSYAIADAQKYVGDIDIREKNAEYEEYLRKRLQTYRDALQEIMSRGPLNE